MKKKSFIFRGKDTSYCYSWLDDTTFSFDFGDGASPFIDENGDEYYIHCECNPYAEDFSVAISEESECKETYQQLLSEEEIKQINQFVLELAKEPFFKIGDKVRIPYFSDCNPHNGKIGTIVWLHEYYYYPDRDCSVLEKRLQGRIQYDDGTTESIGDFYRESSDLVAKIEKIKEIKDRRKPTTIKNLQEQISSEKEGLKKLKEVKEYIRNNFEAKTSEIDTVLDVIAQVADRREMRIKELQEKIVENM